MRRKAVLVRVLLIGGGFSALLLLSQISERTAPVENNYLRRLKRTIPWSNISTVLAILVNDRRQYLRELIRSLAAVRDIHSCLLIFSHNIKSPELDRLIAEEANFGAHTLQLYFPYRLQLFPKVFPGQNPNDCPRNIRKPLAQKLGCENWAWPDQFGHYREAIVTQMKHHFWWMLNSVSALLPAGFGGHVLLLEEDFFVAPDALQVLQKMALNRTVLCPECDILVLGLDSFELEPRKRQSMEEFEDTVAEFWISSEHFRGMALTVKNLKQIRDCAKAFCFFDDYNYDFSLMNANLNCFARPWRVLRPRMPRVIHVGSCGFHRKEMSHCHEATKGVRSFFFHFRDQLFPTELTQKLAPSWASDFLDSSMGGFGGWGDQRDRLLCLNITFR